MEKKWKRPEYRSAVVKSPPTGETEIPNGHMEQFDRSIRHKSKQNDMNHTVDAETAGLVVR